MQLPIRYLVASDWMLCNTGHSLRLTQMMMMMMMMMTMVVVVVVVIIIIIWNTWQ
jgi:hypothetical protein